MFLRIGFQVIYFNWRVGSPIDEIDDIFKKDEKETEGPVTSMTQSNENILQALRKVKDFQVEWILARSKFSI